MNADQIIQRFIKYVGDELDPDFMLDLVNDAMHEIEEEVKPSGLLVVDESRSTAVGQTYVTAIPLPADYFQPAKHIFVGTTKYTPVPLEESVRYRDRSRFYFVDLANFKFHICGQQQSVQPIFFPYYYSTPDLVIDPDPTSPVWPKEFHSLIPLKMAEMYFAIDNGEKPRSWDDRWSLYFQRKLARFKEYDAEHKLAAMDHSAVPPVEGMTNMIDRLDFWP